MTIDPDRAAAAFAASTDFTVGIEEEFALLDPGSLDLVPRFEELSEAARLADPVLAESDRRRADLERDRDPLGPRRGPRRRARPPARHARAAVRPGRAPRGRPRGDGHASVGRLPRAAEHRHGALPARRRRPTVRGTAQQHLLAARPRRRARRGPSRPGVRPPSSRAAITAGHLGELALPRRARLGPALRALAGVHEELPALRHPRRLRLVGGLPRVHRAPRAHELDRRVHAGVVVGAPALLLRHRRGAHLRRPVQRAGVRRADLADRRLRGPGRARRGRGRAARATCRGGSSRRTSGARSATGRTAC